MSHSPIIIHNPYQKQAARNVIDQLPEDGSMMVKITKVTRRRTIEQNALLHKWIGIIAEHVGYTPKEMKDALKFELLQMEQYRDVRGRVQYKLPETSNMSTAELSAFMNEIERWAAQMLSIQLPHPGDRIDEQINQRS